MKVTVNSKTVFMFPTRLAINRLTAGFIRKKLRKEGVKLSRKQTVRMIKALRKYRRKHPEWNLVEACEGGGDRVIVKL
ncbi:MAG: hypothetical protein IJW70_03960 [Clostridia bacterium]|nr:hypothetical protein [Clostridia bacterium]